MADNEKPKGKKPVTRWNVQPLRELEADVYPTPPTDALRKSRGGNKAKTHRRRPQRPSKSD